MTAGSDPVRLSKEVEALRREVARQRSLAEASYALHSTLDQDALLTILLAAASNAVDAERGTVYMTSADGREIWSRVTGGDHHPVTIRLPLGRGIAGAVAKTGETIRIDDAYQDARFDPSTDKRTGFRTRSILCSPIKNRNGDVVGVFQLLNKRHGVFAPDDVEYLDALSVSAALAIENARLHAASIEKERQEQEIRVALEIQRGLQPERLERAEGRLSVAGRNELCEDASGDYYDVFDLPDGRLSIVIGDVSGHGLGAAMVMAEARALFRALSSREPKLPRLVDALNDFLSEDLSAGRFMSLFCATLDPKTAEVQWCSAGHNPPLYYSGATGEVSPLEPTGRVLGVLAGAGYAAGKTFTLSPGDALLLYTDGASEAPSPSGELFEVDRLVAAFKRGAAAEPSALLDRLRQEVAAWTGGAKNRDDLTLVAVKAKSEAP